MCGPGLRRLQIYTDLQPVFLILLHCNLIVGIFPNYWGTLIPSVFSG